MGDAADDAYADMLAQQDLEFRMKQAGCKRCPEPHVGPFECSICYDLGWLDANGKPCEP